MKSIIRGQFVALRKSEVIKAKDGTDLKVIYFTVADRSRKTAKTVNNKTEYTADGFWFCKAYGKDAELIERDFTKVDENGKLISRKIYIEAEGKQFKNTREIDVEMKIPAEKVCEAFGMAVPEHLTGKTVTVTKKEKVEVTDTVYKVRDWDYDDNKPAEDVVNITVENEVAINVE